jgi:pimeloyl-ACP methyl ester carboxylesterase
LPNRLPFHFDFLGEQSLKGIDVPVRAFSVQIDDYEYFSASQKIASSDQGIGISDQKAVRYCSSADGASIAYTQTGEGYPMVAVGSWMTHLQDDWSNPIWGPYIRHLSSKYALVRYDQRGNGMSDWHGIEINFEKMMEDLKAVIGCFEYGKIALYGPSQAAAVSIAYALKHPDRVSHLILFGAYARGRCKRGTSEGINESQAMVTMIRQNWGNENPVARQMMTSLFFPDAKSQEARWFNDFQKRCGPAENIARYREVFDNIDISAHLSDVETPCIVIHSDGDSVAPISEGKYIAARIPGAKMVTVHSSSHMVGEEEPAFQEIMNAIHDFV